MYAQAEGGRTQDVRQYDHGPRWLPRGGVKFRVWAPGQEALKLRIAGLSGNQCHPMKLGRQGWQEVDVADVAPGDRYAFELIDAVVVPDPASRFQPDDVHGWSELLEPSAHAWRVSWQGRRWEEMVIYELHVGTFTPAGTFLAAIDKLDHLAGLGVTAIELMPVA